MAARFELSAGGVVCRRNQAGEIEVVLISTQGGERWALPKGLVERGEPLAEAALREVREETGLEAEIVERLDPIDYWYWWEEEGKKTRRHKKVYFFLMAYRGGDIGEHDFEVEEVRWFPLDEAIERASYASERAILEQVKARGGPPC